MQIIHANTPVYIAIQTNTYQYILYNTYSTNTYKYMPVQTIPYNKC